MVFGLYSVYDEKAKVYLPPFCAKTIGEADRIFDSVIKSGNSTISQYPADHTLYQIGEYDDSSSTLTPMVPVFVSKGDTHA